MASGVGTVVLSRGVRGSWGNVKDGVVVVLMVVLVFGLIAVAGAKIWVDNKVDFTDNKNLIVAAVTLVLGTGDFTLKFGQFSMGGIGTATFGAILLYALLNRSK
jgi:xanthine/uracil permease